MLDAVWSGARGWLTPPVLFVFVNLVIGTIVVMSKLMSAAAAEPGGDGRGQRNLMRAPSVAFDRLRCFSFSRLGLAAEHPQYPPFDDDGAAEAPLPGHVQPAPGGFERRTSFLRAPSFGLDRLRGFSFSRRGPAADHAPVTPQPSSDGAAGADAEPSFLRPAPVEAGMEREPAHIERSQSEAAAEAPARRRRAKKTRKSARAEGGEALRVEAEAERQLPPAVEVDERADDFIRQFREQLRLQRLDSILRYRDTLRRTGTA